MSAYTDEDPRLHGIKTKIRVVPNFPKSGLLCLSLSHAFSFFPPSFHSSVCLSLVWNLEHPKHTQTPSLSLSLFFVFRLRNQTTSVYPWGFEFILCSSFCFPISELYFLGGRGLSFFLLMVWLQWQVLCFKTLPLCCSIPKLLRTQSICSLNDTRAKIFLLLQVTKKKDERVDFKALFFFYFVIFFNFNVGEVEGVITHHCGLMVVGSMATRKLARLCSNALSFSLYCTQVSGYLLECF